MILSKALVTGLVGVQLCMANISGTVTDTGGVAPLAGVVVRLEKGGKTATTGVDGSFTLVVEGTGILGNGNVQPKGLFARISGTMVTVSTSERTDLEVAAFDLNGKSLSTVRRSLGAGVHSIVLPQRGTGVHVYRVKAGDREFVLKGNAIGGVSYGSWAIDRGSFSKSPSKSAKAAAVINDVIAATKDGYLNYRCVIMNADTGGVAIKMIANAGDVTDIDGNVYQSVRIGNQIWTVENLRVTKYNDGLAIPLDTSTETWGNTAAPKYCFFKNTIDADSIKKYGAFYNWYVISPANAEKIAPAGWHVPSNEEWDTLQNYLIVKGYNWDGTTTDDKIAKALAAKTDWYASSTTGAIGCDVTKNNGSGFTALPCGNRDYDGRFGHQGVSGSWWSTTETDTSGAWFRYLFGDLDHLFRLSGEPKVSGLSVRLVKD